jgi:hypothetical protein
VCEREREREVSKYLDSEAMKEKFQYLLISTMITELLRDFTVGNLS